jgi:hypothetical protein
LFLRQARQVAPAVVRHVTDRSCRNSRCLTQAYRSSFAACEKPRQFSGRMSVGQLSHLRHPFVSSALQPFQAFGYHKSVSGPRSRACRMFKDTAPSSDRGKSRRETPVVVAHAMPPSRFNDRRQLAPSRARWMRHDRERSVVESSIPSGVPDIYFMWVGVGSASFDEESGDQ